MPRQAKREDPPHVMMQKRADSDRYSSAQMSDVERAIAKDFSGYPDRKLTDEEVISSALSHARTFSNGYDNYENRHSERMCKILYVVMMRRNIAPMFTDEKLRTFILFACFPRTWETTTWGA